ETRARPDLAPGVLRDQLLEVRGEGRRGLGGAVDVGVAEHLAPHLHPALVAFLSHSLSSPVRCASAAPSKASGCSTFSRCAALGTTSTRAPGIPSAISHAWSGGVAGSSAATR